MFINTRKNLSFDIWSNCLHNIDQDLTSFDEDLKSGNAAAVCFSHTGKCSSSTAQQLPDKCDIHSLMCVMKRLKLNQKRKMKNALHCI